MFAVIEAGGKQHRVHVGDIFEIDRVRAPVGSTLELDRVLMVADGTSVTAGHPVIPDARVISTILAEALGPKIIVFRYKSKKRERKKTGHRQKLCRLRVDDIVVGEISYAERAEAEIAVSAAAVFDIATSDDEQVDAAGVATETESSPESELDVVMPIDELIDIAPAAEDAPGEEA